MYFNNWRLLLKNFEFPGFRNQSSRAPPKKVSGGEKDFGA